MDRKPSNPETDSWIDDRMASLDPAPGWNPDAGRALERLTQPATQPASQWMRLGMTGTILATTVFVLVMLPWQKLWTPEPVATPQTTVAAGQDPVPPPAPSPAQSPAPPQTETVKAEEKPVPEAKPQDALLDLPEREEDLLAYLQALAEKRGIATQQAPQAPPAGVVGVTPPEIAHQVLPEYSDEARKAKITGSVEVLILVRTDGTVQFEKVLKSLGYGLDEKAIEAIKQWRFKPGTKDGKPVDVMISVSLNFGLK
jgi:TonB family protein